MNQLPAAALAQQLLQVDAGDPLRLLRAIIALLRRGMAEDDAVQRQFDARQARLAAALQASPELRDHLVHSLTPWLQQLNLVMAIGQVGVLSRKGFVHELRRRLYDTVNPPPVDPQHLSDALRQVFVREDADWIAVVREDQWLELFRLLRTDAFGKHRALPAHWSRQLLAALEKMAVWVSAEELEDDLLRLDRKILERESPFSALQREMAVFVAHRHAVLDGDEPAPHDDAHLRVLLDQSQRAVEGYRRRSLGAGASIGLTYLLERLQQTLRRIGIVLDIVNDDVQARGAARAAAAGLFRDMAVGALQRDSATALWRQNIGLMARKVSNNVSGHGEHYVTSDRASYGRMLLKAAGAGLVIPFMALLKLQIDAAGYPMLVQSLLFSLNYGLGFVLIHVLGFTVATKQPAMTAAYIADTIERAPHSRANPVTVIELMAQVSRSQFIAIVGNVSVALALASLIGWVYAFSWSKPLLDHATDAYVRKSLQPFAGLALLHAAIAGVWLFLSGLIAGYFDNRFQLLGLRERFIGHPLLRRLLSDSRRERIGDYLAKHYGALWGNFLFGVLLGMTGFFGAVLGLPIDIRHVAFSAANLGFATLAGWFDFMVHLLFVLMIGGMNLLVSFSLALMVGLRARGLRISDPQAMLRALIGKLMVAPWEFLFPSAEPETAPRQSADKR